MVKISLRNLSSNPTSTQTNRRQRRTASSCTTSLIEVTTTRAHAYFKLPLGHMHVCAFTVYITAEVQTSIFFTDKIVKLRASVSDRLCTLSVLLPSHLSFPAHNGSVLNKLDPVTADEVYKLLSSSLPKSSNMDIIPTSLVLRCQSVFSEIIAEDGRDLKKL